MEERCAFRHAAMFPTRKRWSSSTSARASRSQSVTCCQSGRFDSATARLSLRARRPLRSMPGTSASRSQAAGKLPASTARRNSRRTSSRPRSTRPGSMFSMTNTREGAWSAMPLSTPAPARAAAVASPLQSTTVRGRMTSGSFHARARTSTTRGPSACASATVACNTTLTFPDSATIASATRAKAGMENGSTQRPASSRSGPPPAARCRRKANS